MPPRSRTCWPATALGVVLWGLLGIDASQIAGGPCDPGDVISGTLCNPLLPLSNDVSSGGEDLDGPPITAQEAAAAGLSPAAVDAILYVAGLQGMLTSQQQALVGCGPFYGTLCDGHGISLFQTEATALLQSLLDFEGAPPGAGDPDAPGPNAPLTTDPLFAQPGTIGFQGAPVCTRRENDQTLVLPGCRGLLDVGPDGVPDTLDEILAGTGDDSFEPGYVPGVSGTMGEPGDGTTTGAGPFPTFPAQPRVHPFTGQFFSSELAVLSWNAVMSFAALSLPPDEIDTNGDGVVDTPTDGNGDGFPDPLWVAQDEFDVTAPAFALTNGFDDDGDGVIDNPEEGDPDRIGAFRSDGCSFAAPYACRNVQAFRNVLTRELPDDPSGPPQRRWVWETGAEHLQTDEATGGLADFASWTFHALGPAARTDKIFVSDGNENVLFVLGPPEGVGGPPDSPLVVSGSPGPDGISGTPDDPFVGLVYGVVPEPSKLLLHLAAGLAVAGLAARRRNG